MGRLAGEVTTSNVVWLTLSLLGVNSPLESGSATPPSAAGLRPRAVAVRLRLRALANRRPATLAVLVGTTSPSAYRADRPLVAALVFLFVPTLGGRLCSPVGVMAIRLSPVGITTASATASLTLAMPDTRR